MPLFTRKDINILFVHIPKTAGMYVYENFYKRGFKMQEPLGRIVDGVTIQHVLAKQAFEIYKNYNIAKSFCIVRHPIHRLVSECNYHGTYGSEINSCAKKIFELYRNNSSSYRDNHIRPQSDFINEQTVYFKYENGVDTAINKFFADIDGELIHDNTVVNASKKRYNIEQLNDETINMIREFYKEDFNRLNY